MFTFQALNILMFLLPGFLCMAVLGILTPSIKRDNLQKIVNALIFSLLIYAIYAVIYQSPPVSLVKETVGQQIQYSFNFQKKSIGLLVLISLLIPVLISYFIKYDLHMWVLRKLKVTDRTSRTNVWFDIFTDKKTYIIINFEDGRRLYGWPEYYSDNPENKSLFLCQAAWITKEGKYIDLNNEGILITPNERIDTIEFVKKE